MSHQKKRGRPPLVAGESSTAVNLRIPSSDYDRACQLAKREGKSVSEVLRRGVTKAVRAEFRND